MTTAAAVARIWDDLSSTDGERQTDAASRLCKYVENTIQQLPTDTAIKTWDQTVNEPILSLLRSRSEEQQLGGLFAIENLVKLNATGPLDIQRELYKWWNVARELVNDGSEKLVIAMARAVGKIIHIGAAAYGSDFILSEIPSIIGLLASDSKTDQKRLAGVLLLTEIADGLGGNLGDSLDDILTNVFVPLHDPRITVRDGAAQLLGSALQAANRHPDAETMYRRVLEDVYVGFDSPLPEVVHGSLIALPHLLFRCGGFMHSRYDTVAEAIVRFRSHRSSDVRRATIVLVGHLATWDHETFRERHLYRFMPFLIEQMSRGAERDAAFVTFGHVVRHVGEESLVFLEQATPHFWTALHPRARSLNPNDAAAAFEALSMVIAVAGSEMAKFFDSKRLDMIFSTGVDADLINLAFNIASHMPSLYLAIQERFLNLLSVKLIGLQYRPTGSQPELDETAKSTMERQIRVNRRDPLGVRIALEAAGRFRFQGERLTEFVRDAVLPYMDDDDADVRMAAVATTCALLKDDAQTHAGRSPHPDLPTVPRAWTRVLNDALTKVLSLCIADTDPRVRGRALATLQRGNFDIFLSQPEHLPAIFLSVNDNISDHRFIGIDLVGRVCQQNPALVMPWLRKTLIQITSSLQFTDDHTTREEAAHVLTELTGVTKPLLGGYALTLLGVLLPKASDPNPTVAALALRSIGELSEVGRQQFLEHVPQLMNTIIGVLNDPTGQLRRDTALKALADICFNTGYVIDPIVEYPKLLPALNKILEMGESQDLRREAIRVLGVLGAIDPYRRTNNLVEDDPMELNVIRPSSIQTAIPIGGSATEDYYQRVVMSTLLKVLADSSASGSHYFIVECIMTIFKTQGLAVVNFLPQVVPAFIGVIEKTTTPRLQEFHVQQLAVLIDLIGQHIRNFATELTAMIRVLWPTLHLHLALVKLVEALARALDTEFRPFLPTIVPLTLSVFDDDYTTRGETAKIHILRAITAIGGCVEDYLHLIVPAVCRPLEASEAQPPLKQASAKAIHGLALRMDVLNHAARLVLALVRNLEVPDSLLRAAIMDVLSVFMVQMEEDFGFFIPVVSKAMVKHKVVHETFTKLLATVNRGDRIVPPPALFDRLPHESQETHAPVLSRHVGNVHELQAAWAVPRSAKQTGERWVQWYTNIASASIRQSGSSALRACVPLLDQQVPISRDIAKELFHIAFLSCWSEQYGALQDEIMHSIAVALADLNLPLEIGMGLLNLAEFMEHQDQPLRLSNTALRDCANRFQAYAKALHWTELEFHAMPASDEILHQLIAINTKLQQDDAAYGIVQAITEQNGQDMNVMNVEWSERLQKWDVARAQYEEQRHNSKVIDLDVSFGLMRCYGALGEWEELRAVVDELWGDASQVERVEIAPYAATAVWALGEWQDADDLLDTMEPSLQRTLFQAVVHIKREKFQHARHAILRGRDDVSRAIYGLTGDDYVRNYGSVHRAQMFAELEEVIEYKFSDDDRKTDIRETWKKRLLGCQADVTAWQRIILVRSLVLEPTSAVDIVVKFANLCRKARRYKLAKSALDSVVVPDEELRRIPQADYSRVKLQWAEGYQADALRHLEQFRRHLTAQLRLEDEHRPMLLSPDEQDEYTRLLARSWLKRGEWSVACDPHWIQNRADDVLESFSYAAKLDPHWFKAWHTLALHNIEILNLFTTPKKGQTESETAIEALESYAVVAVEGLFRSIRLCKASPLQDVLRLLTLWFKFGHLPSVSDCLTEGFSMVTVDTWIEVIPQIIARIQTPSPVIRRHIEVLLSHVGRAHPQSLIFPLIVASGSSNAARKHAGRDMIDRMREDNPDIVEQALLVGDELIRVAILWHERWHDALEEASRLYFTEKNPDGMLRALEPLHALVNGGGSTSREMSFVQTFGADLAKAYVFCQRYRDDGDINYLERAWAIYYDVFKRLDKQVLPHLLHFDLQHVSPRLLAFQDFVLAVPGTYQPSKPVLRIHSFTTRVSIISSKQRPRRMSLRGVDGREHEYLLKGHEDLRQDERVIQFLGLVNSHLTADHESYKRRLHMQRFPIIPLAPNAGLIGWAQGTDTFHVLVRDYREARNILLNIENRLMVQMANDYKTLTLLQKVEVFQHAMDNTTGQDLFHVMWLRSANSENWLERRTTYTRSLAVSSMVGYVLGLGDRHPSNILIDRVSGKVIHIDFGDCFEIAMRRDEFPEKVPFRLTRMLIHAMEPSGIRGSYHNTADITMRVLRENRESLLAVLEAFIYDPLISWRLLKVNETEATGIDDVIVPGMANPLAHGPNRKPKANEQAIFDDEDEDQAKHEQRLRQALAVYSRVRQKLNGRDFNDGLLDVNEQVKKLIHQAVDPEALCQHFPGWCACW